MSRRPAVKGSSIPKPHQLAVLAGSIAIITGRGRVQATSEREEKGSNYSRAPLVVLLVFRVL